MNEKPNGTQRALRIISALKGRTFNGASNKELAEAIGDSAVNVSRTLKVLIEEGFVVKLTETGRFALSMRILQIAETHRREMDRMQHRMAESDQRITAGSI